MLNCDESAKRVYFANHDCYSASQIGVPDDVLLPTVTVQECGDEVCTKPSKVRAGGSFKDVDSAAGFSLDFGPDDFMILGRTISARIHNVSAKTFTFQSISGSLHATSLRTAGWSA